MSEELDFLNGMKPSQTIIDRVNKLVTIQARRSGTNARHEKQTRIIAEATEDLKQLVTVAKSNGSRKPKRDSSELSKIIDLGNTVIDEIDQELDELQAENSRYRNIIHDLIAQQISQTANKEMESSERKLRAEMHRYCVLHNAVVGSVARANAKFELHNFANETDSNVGDNQIRAAFDNLDKQAYQECNEAA